MKHIWYEVYSFHQAYGSQTIETFDTMAEAKIFKKIIKNDIQYKNDEIYIDKWGMEHKDSIPKQLEII